MVSAQAVCLAIFLNSSWMLMLFLVSGFVSDESRLYLWWLTPWGCDAANTELCWLQNSVKFTSLTKDCIRMHEENKWDGVGGQLLETIMFLSLFHLLNSHPLCHVPLLCCYSLVPNHSEHL